MAMNISGQNAVHAYHTKSDRDRLVVLGALLKCFFKLLENNITSNCLNNIPRDYSVIKQGLEFV
jgi:hypothetical protein